MQGRQSKPGIDTANLIKAGKIPIVAAAAAGLIWVAGISNPIALLALVAIVMIFALAGYWYANNAVISGLKPLLVEVAINGAILGIAISFVYGLVAGICISVTTSGYYGVLNSTPGSGGLVLTILEGAVAGAISASSWYAFKSGMIKID